MKSLVIDHAVEDEPGMGMVERFGLAATQETLFALLKDLFEKHWRRCARAEFYRVIADQVGGPVSWGIRLFNGKGEQQLTVFLPNPFLGERDNIEAAPDWSKLALWDRLRADYLGLDPEPADRTATGFWHG